jgi:hypothetical protein
MPKCLTCGLEVKKVDKDGICPDCKRVTKNREKSLEKQNYNWMELAKENEIELFDRQPGETDFEYKLWVMYRDMYPAKKPTYSAVSQTLCVPIGTVKAVGAKWSYQARLQAWVKHTDELLLKNRQQDIVDMNKKHVDMANKLNEKLATAIDNIDEYNLKPGELAGLLKLSTELERKARLDNTEVAKPHFDDVNPNLKKVDTKTEDMADIIGILKSAGILNPTAVGIKQTTEVIVKED